MKKYLINDDDAIRVGKNICVINTVFPFLHREKLFKEEKELVEQRIKNGIISEIWNLGDPLAPTPLMQGDLIANKQQPDMEFILMDEKLIIPLTHARQALEAYCNDNPPITVKMPDWDGSFEEFKSFESKTNDTRKEKQQMSQPKLSKFETMVLQLIPLGKKNAASLAHLTKLLDVNYRTIIKTVRDLRLKGFPIGSSQDYGYYKFENMQAYYQWEQTKGARQ